MPMPSKATEAGSGTAPEKLPETLDVNDARLEFVMDAAGCTSVNASEIAGRE